MTSLSDSIAKKALEFATFVHTGQKDKQGKDYILHPQRVGESVAYLSEKHEAVGYLHDTVEDTDATLDDLRILGMPEDVVEAVDALSRRDGETYADFIERIKLNDIAKAVKIADIYDNMRPGGTESLYKRYVKALHALGVDYILKK